MKLMEKDTLANIFTLGGISFTIAQVQTVLTVLILITGLVLNIQRIVANYKKKKTKQDNSK